MMASKVIVAGESFQLAPDGSEVVKKATQKLLGTASLDELMNDLEQFEKLLQIAYHAAGAAGPKFVEVQIEVYALNQRVCNKSALIISRFQTAAAAVLDNLQNACRYQMDGFDELAVSKLADVATVAGDMKMASQELREEFDKQVEEVTRVHNKTMEARGQAASDTTDMLKRKEDEERRRAAVEVEMKEAERLEREAEAAHMKYEIKERDAMNELSSKTLNTLAYLFTFGTVDLNESTRRQIEEYKRLKLEQSEKAGAYRRQKSEKLAMVTEITKISIQCGDEADMSRMAEQSLHDCVAQLKQLSQVMMRASLFWQQMEDHCKSLAKNAVKDQMRIATKLSDEKRTKFWTSDTFKRNAIRFYSEWVALKDVCKKYMEPIVAAQKELFSYLSTFEEYKESQSSDCGSKDLESDCAGLTSGR